MLSLVRPIFATTCTHCFSHYSSQLHLYSHRKPNVLLALFFHFPQWLYKRYYRSPANSICRRLYPPLLDSPTLLDRQDSVYPFLVYILSTLSPDASDYCPLVTFNKASGQQGKWASSFGLCLVSNLYPLRYSICVFCLPRAPGSSTSRRPPLTF